MTSNSMVAAVTPQELTPQEDYIIGNLVIEGNLAVLSIADKVAYYHAVCKRLGLDPMTQPLQIVKFQGKEVLYCGRSGAQQLNHLHKISHSVISRETVNDCYIVTVRATLPDGRYTENCGAVSLLSSAKGQLMTGTDFCHAIMKAETKAKRRATLDLVGQMAFMASDAEMEDMLNIETTKATTEQSVQPATPADMGFGNPPPTGPNIQQAAGTTQKKD